MLISILNITQAGATEYNSEHGDSITKYAVTIFQSGDTVQYIFQCFSADIKGTPIIGVNSSRELEAKFPA